MLDALKTLHRFPVGFREALYALTIGLPRGTIGRAIAGRKAKPFVESDPLLRDPEYLGRMLAVLDLAARKYFRWDVRGIENVPAHGPALLVGNHNGGLVTTDSYLTLLAVWNHFGPARVVCPLAHDLLFFDPVLGRIASRLGVMRAGHDSAAKVFGHGHTALVYPGSDLDTWRLFSERHRIELGGRLGFLKLVLRQRVPIIPVVSAGTHEQFVVLARGDDFARRVGLKKNLRAEACPVVLSLPWGLTSGYLPYFPLPAQTTIAFGKPIAWPDLDTDAANDPEILKRCYDRVRSEMQQLLNSISEGRRWLRGQKTESRR